MQKPNWQLNPDKVKCLVSLELNVDHVFLRMLKAIQRIKDIINKISMNMINTINIVLHI